MSRRGEKFPPEKKNDAKTQSTLSRAENGWACAWERKKEREK
jgi:hypothetical protein